MKFTITTGIALTLLMLTACSHAGKSSSDESNAYIYDKEDFGHYYRELIYLKTTESNTIPFYFAYPKNGKIQAVALLLHGITSHKEVWWQGAGPYSSRGEYRHHLLKNNIAIIAMDSRFHGQRANEFNFRNPKVELLYNKHFDKLYEMLTGSIEDVVSIMNYINSRKGHSNLSFGIVGDSMGGIMSFPLAIKDERIKFIISMVAAPQPVPGHKSIHSISPLTLASEVTKPVRIIASSQDKFYPMSDMHNMFGRLASNDKELIVLNEPHDFQQTHAARLARWALSVIQ